ncbi:DEAD-box ATP-dependent RNA helicase 7-like [Syzygium oleosum]|uniref:DEAD-box ATP-dependent RNA helicase 7-like n=1 Tax=Syzygium oleosum TaxID=219896 RepID=UPI0024BB3A0D|nr:DEAD-box ATP-dependent RNA helicase 7-like [Syzygium oleosum]
MAALQPSNAAQAAGIEAAESITQISDSVIPAFKSDAEQLLNTSGMSAVELLAKALAKAPDYSEIKSRSLLSSLENHVTLLLETGRPIYTPSYAFGVLRRFLPEEKVESAKDLTLTADGNGVVFDVAAEDLDTFLAGHENAANVSLEVVTTLPRLQERDQSRGGRFGGGAGRGGFGGRGAVVFLGVEVVGVVVSLAKGVARFPVASVVGEVAATIDGDKVICSQFLGVGASRKKGINLCRIMRDNIFSCRCRNFGRFL